MAFLNVCYNSLLYSNCVFLTEMSFGQLLLNMNEYGAIVTINVIHYRVFLDNHCEDNSKVTLLYLVHKQFFLPPCPVWQEGISCPAIPMQCPFLFPFFIYSAWMHGVNSQFDRCLSGMFSGQFKRDVEGSIIRIFQCSSLLKSLFYYWPDLGIVCLSPFKAHAI